MIAVIKTGGKQYRVKRGDILKIEKIDGTVNDDVSFDNVLMVINEQEDVDLGAPLIQGRSVKGKILEQGKGKKVSIIKYKPKVRYRRKTGHRQPFTKVEITSV